MRIKLFSFLSPLTIQTQSDHGQHTPLYILIDVIRGILYHIPLSPFSKPITRNLDVL